MLKKPIWNTIETTLFYYSDNSTSPHICLTYVWPTQKNPWIEMFFMNTSHVQLSGEDLLRLHDQNILTTCLCPVFTHFAISCFSTFFIWCKCVWIFRKVDWPLFRCFQSHHTNSSHFLEISVANGNLIHCNVTSVLKNCDNIDIAPWNTKKSKLFQGVKCSWKQSVPRSKVCWGVKCVKEY